MGGVFRCFLLVFTWFMLVWVRYSLNGETSYSLFFSFDYKLFTFFGFLSLNRANQNQLGPISPPLY